jgi:hypothetical protein
MNMGASVDHAELGKPRITSRTLNLLGAAEVRMLRPKQSAGKKFADKVDKMWEGEVIRK